MRRGARQVRRGLRPALADQRQHLQAQVIARMLNVLVAQVLDPAQPFAISVNLQLCTRDIQQWPHKPALPQRSLHWHSRQAAHPGTAQQTKQQGLGLIVAVLRGQQQVTRIQPFGKARIARLPRRTLQARARLDLHAHYFERHAIGRAHLTAMRRPVVRRRLQTVMNMNRADWRHCMTLRQLHERMQQYGRIQTA